MGNHPLHVLLADSRVPPITFEDVERVARDTGMGELQAYREEQNRRAMAMNFCRGGRKFR